MPKKRTFKRCSAKNTLRLPDLDHSKTSVLQSLSSAASKRTYAFAINDFIAWYLSLIHIYGVELPLQNAIN